MFLLFLCTDAAKRHAEEQEAKAAQKHVPGDYRAGKLSGENCSCAVLLVAQTEKREEKEMQCSVIASSDKCAHSHH